MAFRFAGVLLITASLATTGLAFRFSVKANLTSDQADSDATTGKPCLWAEWPHGGSFPQPSQPTELNGAYAFVEGGSFGILGKCSNAPAAQKSPTDTRFQLEFVCLEGPLGVKGIGFHEPWQIYNWESGKPTQLISVREDEQRVVIHEKQGSYKRAAHPMAAVGEHMLNMQEKWAKCSRWRIAVTRRERETLLQETLLDMLTRKIQDMPAYTAEDRGRIGRAVLDIRRQGVSTEGLMGKLGGTDRALKAVKAYREYISSQFREEHPFRDDFAATMVQQGLIDDRSTYSLVQDLSNVFRGGRASSGDSEFAQLSALGVKSASDAAYFTAWAEAAHYKNNPNSMPFEGLGTVIAEGEMGPFPDLTGSEHQVAVPLTQSCRECVSWDGQGRCAGAQATGASDHACFLGKDALLVMFMKSQGTGNFDDVLSTRILLYLSKV